MRFTLTFDRPAGTPGRCAPVVILGVTVVCHSPCLPNQVPGALLFGEPPSLRAGNVGACVTLKGAGAGEQSPLCC